MTEIDPWESVGDDLRWLAFRYAANELDPAAVAAFELRLDGDQQVREAVAEAVATIAAVRSAPMPVLACRGLRAARIRRMIGAASALTAAALALAIYRPWNGGGNGEADRDRDAKPSVASLATANEDVALAWSALHNDPDVSGSSADVPEEMGRDDGEDEAHDLESPPSWLAAAFEIDPSAVQEN